MNFLSNVLFTPLNGHGIFSLLLIFVGILIVGWAFWKIRLYFLQMKFIAKIQWTLLEIRIPKEIDKSPKAMELFLINAIFQTGGAGNIYKKYWLGRVLMWFSLEIVSIGGDIHFYIYTPTWLKDTIEAQLYAQFPQLMVFEVPDYTQRIPPYEKDGDWNMYACEFKQVKPEAYPIKTYVDWGLDKGMEGLESEQQVDPLSSLIESMASLRAGEEWWLQIIVRAIRGDHWKEEARHEAEKLMKEEYGRLASVAGSEIKLDFGKFTEGTKTVLEAIDRKITKHGFYVGIRTIYLARKNAYNKSRHTSIKNMFNSFNTQDLNILKRTGSTGFDNPWEDVAGLASSGMKKRYLEEYRHREYFDHEFKFELFDFYVHLMQLFHAPSAYHRYELVMNAEELATIFHFPGRVLQSPNLERIEARKSEPPANLPV